MRLLVVSGEPSGDMYARLLGDSLRRLDPQAEVRHFAGDGESAVMGFWEVAKKAGAILSRLRRCRREIRCWKPDAVILVDYPSFNLRVAATAHRMGAKVFWYIAPKVWASREGRLRQLRKYVDHTFIIFPFEKDYFASRNLPCTYPGNPLTDIVEDIPEEEGESRGNCIALLPGSRDAEIASMMPTFMEAAGIMHGQYPDCQFIVAAAPGRRAEDFIRWMEGKEDYVKVVEGDTRGVLRRCRAAAVNSGTASLEAALTGTPEVVAYRMSPLSYSISRRIIKVRYISLPNLILGREAVKELIQKDFTPESLSGELIRLSTDGACRDRMASDFSEIRSSLHGSGSVSDAVAGKILNLLSGDS